MEEHAIDRTWDIHRYQRGILLRLLLLSLWQHRRPIQGKRITTDQGIFFTVSTYIFNFTQISYFIFFFFLNLIRLTIFFFSFFLFIFFFLETFDREGFRSKLGKKYRRKRIANR